MLLSSAQTATYMKIFSTLAEKSGPCTTAELAAPSGADVVFTGTFFTLSIVDKGQKVQESMTDFI